MVKKLGVQIKRFPCKLPLRVANGVGCIAAEYVLKLPGNALITRGSSQREVEITEEKIPGEMTSRSNGTNSM